MIFLENFKTVCEVITAFSTATIVFKHIPESMKKFFLKTIPLFFKGTSELNGKKVRFFEAVRIEKENQERLKRIIPIVAPDYKENEYLVLNKEELLNMLENSKLFIHLSKRKN